MTLRIGRQLVLAASVVLALAFAAQPVLADTELGHTGTVGSHSLEDFDFSPGANCRYKSVAEHNDLKLIKIIVGPPLMKAVAGKSAQTVGWRFTVQRRTQGIGGATEWVSRYTSAEMTTVTDDVHNASFSKASAPVRTGPRTAGGMYQYRVLVTMLWHRSDGSVQGRARHRVDFYRAISDVGLTGLRNGKCDAYWIQPDG